MIKSQLRNYLKSKAQDAVFETAFSFIDFALIADFVTAENWRREVAEFRTECMAWAS